MNDIALLPDLEEPYSLTAEQIERYREDGHILLRGVASREEVSSYRPILQQVVEEMSRKKDSQGRIEDYTSLFIQVTNVWRKSEALKRFVFAKRFAKIAADLMGVKGVRLYHDQALFKPAGGKPTPWHQDQVYWPLETEHTITMWMPLVDVTREMGSMIFATGSHKDGQLGDLAISDDAQTYFEKLIADKDYRVFAVEANAGDATFHSGLLIHSALGNRAKTSREVITIIYYADGTRIMKPDNKYRHVDLDIFHPGQKPGEPAASALNPLLYHS